MTELIGTISALAFGGKGILRNPSGKVYFVPFTIPQEEVACSITKEKKDYGEAVCDTILKPSPFRVTPPCPYFGRCGGCQLQQIEYNAQVEYKKEMVQAELKKIFPEVRVSIKPSKTPYAYRRKIDLTLRPAEKGFLLGYIGFDNHTLIEVESCPIFLEPGDPILLQTKELLSKLTSTHQNSGKARLLKTGERCFALHLHFKMMPKNAEAVLKGGLGSSFESIFCSSPGIRLSFGKKDFRLQHENLTIHYNSEAFLQNHPDESAEIYSLIRDTVDKWRPTLLLDLYSGIGITSLLSAPFCKAVESVEFNREAVRLAKLNSELNALPTTCHLGKVEERLPSLLKKHPDAALCNPPREGMAKEAAELLACSPIRSILYTSCHPATLSRDLKPFKQHGFTPVTVRAFDMFPQTGHIETVIELTRELNRN